MANTRTVDFLPEIFQTPANKQFLSATLDQLVQEPQFNKTQGFVGRRVGPGVNPNDPYVVEIDQTRANYQLEPGVVRLDASRQKVLDAITYPGINDALSIQGAQVNNNDRLYTSDYYTWDPFVNFDKFINFSQYYWLPDGPDAVDVFSGGASTVENFEVIKNLSNYQISGLAGNNPLVTLVRGGTYTFQVNQSSNFWIQQEPGVSGTLAANPNISSREITGVSNNGESSGVVTFTVPTKDDQEFFYNLSDAGTVDLITDLKFNQINNIFVSEFLRLYGGIDGITNLNGRTVILTNQQVNPADGGWLNSTQYDPLTQNSTNNGLPGSFDSLPYDLETVVPPDNRYSVWRIQYVTANGSQPYIRLVQPQPVANLSKILVLFGNKWNNTQWWKNNSGFWNIVPNLTTVFDTLYYQDGSDPLAFGTIKIIEPSQSDIIDIDDILGKKVYTSPNGVVFTNNLKVVFNGPVTPNNYQNNEYYVSGVGSSIQLLPVSNYVVPESYSDQITENTLDIPDYLVMSLDSRDLSAWSRVNRWFHIDVLAATAEYNNTEVIVNNEFRAKRPILEYRGGLKLFNMGTEAKQPVNIVDFTITDALSNINGAIGFSIDNYSLTDGTRIVFAADTDPEVRNKIYVVEFITPEYLSDTSVINLTIAEDGLVMPDQSVVTLSGETTQGTTYYYDGTTWILAQQKTSRNQPPLFDVFDLNGVSFGNNVKYPSTNFVGTKLFSYAVGSGLSDSVLGFPLQYLTLTNVGDIVFDNNFYTDTFLYVDSNVGTTKNISDGIVREYVNRTNFVTEIGWQSAITKSKIYQQFLFTFTSNEPLILDIPVLLDEPIPAVKIYVAGVFQVPGSYSISVGNNNTTIVLNNTTNIPAGADIVVLALSNVPSNVGFYQVPENLENNPLNENSNRFTLGTARAHYQTIAENLPQLQGVVNGANNIRDLGNVIPYGLKILQQSSPLTLAGYFLRSSQYNIFSSLEYNSREYEKIKAQILATSIANDYTNMSVPAILDSVLQELSAGKTDINSFYWSDMLPSGSVYTELKTTYTAISVPVFDTTRVYNFTSANYQGLLVYINDQQLLRGLDYVVATDGPRLTITAPISIGDVITIREYDITAGSFIPNTPTKLGLYPASRPIIYLDTTYVNPTTVIRGHDGSITIGFGDFRDELLLEFERRIYNNLKLDGNPIPLVSADVVPGQFRTTNYSLGEINQILGRDFLSWVGWNKLDYKTQEYIATNEFTYNYSTSGNRLSNNRPLVVGAWRGLYNYFYDTTDPNTRPWQMLGFSQQPDWWQDYYGPAPYTDGNLVLWDDLEAGLVRDPAGEYIIPKYRRPGLTNIIPSGSEGQLLSPLQSLVSNYTSTDFRKSWTVGDDGPVENAWRTSSSYPFAVMRLLALTRPAEFFSLFADRDLYRYNDNIGQYLYNNRFRLDANGVEVYGNGVSKASYINWIVDYNRQTGVNSTSLLSTDLQSLDVRLCYRLAAFSAKNLLQIYTEKTSPESTNSGLLLPDESYNLLLYKNVPFDTLTYSSVTVQKTDQGFAVWGFSTLTPYFTILQSRSSGTPVTISGGGVSVQVSTTHTSQTVTVPYGYVFPTATAVADFLISYGALLQSQGMIFNDVENGYVLNWQQMVTEFLYWTTQSWAIGSIINLNPNATKLIIERPLSIVDNINLQTQENVVLDQDHKQLATRDLIIDRQNNRFSIETTNSQTISFINLKFVSYEHMVVLDNRSIFADLIYDPVTDARQSRIRLSAVLSADWNGQLNAPGFILNQDNVKEWNPLSKYAKGEIVAYKNLYYSALDIVEPSDRFNFSQWTRSDFTQIQQGLLPNLANKSDQLANTYSIYTSNLERDQDLFSYGLIGFRPREYMTALNLDDISQVNLYQQFLGNKGTVQAAELFKFADLGRGVTEFDIFENWAVQRATYGANANRSYYELQLNEALLKSNPSLIEVIEPEQQSAADQTVLVNNIWKESYKISNPNILTTVDESITDVALPSAGYVNIDDIDITLFDINDSASLNEVIDQIGVDTRIWVAKTNSYDWGVFRCYSIPGAIVQVFNNLDGTSTVTFTQQHNLSPSDLLIIKSFDEDVDGVYQVLTTPTTKSIVIAYEFLNVNQLTIDGAGVGLGLETLRVAQPSDTVLLPESNRLTPGARVWIDNGGDNRWQVIEKQDVFVVREQLIPDIPVANGQFGRSADQSTQNLFAAVGQPAAFDSGSVVYYIRNNLGNYQQTEIQILPAVGAKSFGHSVSIGDQNWIAVGAPDSEWEPLGSTLFQKVGLVAIINRQDGSGQFTHAQLLTPPSHQLDEACEFGYSVSMSQDQHWLYIGAPGINRAYVYGLKEIEEQSVRYSTSGSETVFKYSDHIKVNDTDALVAAKQLAVILDNELVTGYTVDLNTGTINLGFAPTPNQNLVISRRGFHPFDIAGSLASYDISEHLYTVDGIDSFKVSVNNIIQRPKIDYTFDAGVITFIETADGGIPQDGDEVVVIAGSYYQYVDEIICPDTSDDNLRFGSSVSCTTDGQQVVIGAVGYNGADSTIKTFSSSVAYNVGEYVFYQNNIYRCILNSAGGNLPTNEIYFVLVSAPGAVYVFNRSVQRFISSSSTQTNYQVSTTTIVQPASVKLNNRFLTNAQGNITGDYTVSGNTIIFTSAPTVGDNIVIDVNTFNYIQKISAQDSYTFNLFGAAIDICSNDCSLYIGAPGDGSLLPQAGSVQRSVNQSRVFGTLKSLVANPVVNAFNSIRINNIEVVVPPNDDLSQPDVKNLANAINEAGIPNVIASVTGDLTFIGNGLTTEFYINSVYSSVQSYTSVVLVNNVEQTIGVDYTYDNNSRTIIFTTAPESGSVITVVTGQLILTVKNTKLAGDQNQLTVWPGVSSAELWQRLEFVTYEYTQTITSPAPSINAQFGSSVVVDSSAKTLVVGTPRGNSFSPTTFDQGSTIFDAKTTTYSTTRIESGVVYTYDLLPAVNSSSTNPSKFVFGQQIFNQLGLPGDLFGTAVSYVDQVLLVTSPGHDLITSTGIIENSGKLDLYINPTDSPAWVTIRRQQPSVNVKLINSVFVYDAITSAKTEFFDFIDPLQGKILGAAQQNINFISAIDPAAYNVGVINNNGRLWSESYVGQIWWDTDNTRFIDPNQNDIVYASRRWSQLFPRSTVDIYQWVVSDVPPAEYTGEGIPKSIESYSIVESVDVTGVIKIKYYFWVRNITTIQSTYGKTLSTTSISRYIESPKSSGIPYVAFINPSTTALYNAVPYISAQDTILSIEFDRELTDSAVHVEYELIPQDRADGFLSESLYRKFQDSLCGVDTSGNLVPDINLRPANRYGVQFRPRQSMFVDRFAALENYLSRVNLVLSQFPITETKSFNLLNSQEPQPNAATGEWNKKVINIEELSYQNLLIVPVGYRYLVESDSRQNGLWTIYEVTESKTFESLQLVRVQTYRTNQYWSYIDWYQVGYNPSVRPVLEVKNVSDLDTISVPVGSVVRVRANAQGKFEIYLLEVTGWTRVGLQDGTIKISDELWNYQLGRFGFDVEVFDSQYYDQEPVIETRKIIQAINQELLIDDLAIERNRAMILMFNFVLSEQIAPEWITKTSLIDVDHKIRQLLPFQTFNRDNQEFVIDYIQEVKPYHVQVREFNLIYEGFDIYSGTLTDFDVPAYWKSDLTVPQFVSPVLTPYTLSTAVGTGRETTISNASNDDPIWATEPWVFWHQNYSLAVESVTVINGGQGYTIQPLVTVVGDSIEPAELVAVISSTGIITAINVVNPGRGYLTTPTIVISGNGNNAIAYPNMGNALVRNFKTTLKYDRYQYQADVVDWQPNESYDNGTLVKFDDRVWAADSGDSLPVQSDVFDPDQWVQVPAGELAALDRTQGYYEPRANMPGLDLPLLIDGLDYPGVQVTGPSFDQGTGFDIGNFDVNPFDNISFGPEGRPTYSPTILDAIYESNFLDSFLGTRPADINVDGGAFVDTYSSHAPEELVPGSEFDTLDFKVFTTPGADWLNNGHGFDEGTFSYVFEAGATNQFSFAGIVNVPIQVRVVDQTQGISLIPNVNYTINWGDQTVTVFSDTLVTVDDNDIISIIVYSVGGGNQLFKQTYIGTDIGRSLFIPVTFSLITQPVVFVNGELNENYGIFPENAGTLIIFNQTFGPTDLVSILLLSDSPVIIPVVQPFDFTPFDAGDVTGDPGSFDFSGIVATGDVLDFGWSAPSTEYFVASSSSNTTFTLTDSFIGTNRAVAIVEKNGIRATPPAGAEYIADGSTAYALPTRIGISQGSIQNSDVLVWVDNVLQIQGVDYIIEPFTVGDIREVIFTDAPDSGSIILIFVTTNANYIITPGSPTSTLTWRTGRGFDIVTGDVIAVTTWNATEQQDILNKIFVGPVTSGFVDQEGFDDTEYDSGTVSGAPGSFDYAEGISITVNDFQLGRTITDASRLWVTLNGYRLFVGRDFFIDGQELVLASGPIAANETLVVTLFTNTVVPNALAFRIFQDMRGVQATYRITNQTTTVLAQPLAIDDDIIYVKSVSALSVPDLDSNIWGVVTINGERILYRNIDFVNNTVSSLLRGTAGTAITSHSNGSVVYNMSRVNLAPNEYQDKLVSSTYLSNGTDTEFVTNINLEEYDIDFAVEVVEVYVGGSLQPKTSYYLLDINPVIVVFDDAPPANQEIVIVVRQGLSWYQPGISTPSDGVPLQDTNTIAARFFKGLY